MLQMMAIPTIQAVLKNILKNDIKCHNPTNLIHMPMNKFKIFNLVVCETHWILLKLHKLYKQHRHTCAPFPA